jgi:Winged helix DNA-binding domain
MSVGPGMIPAMTELTRTQVLAHRVAAHGLVERVARIEDVAVLHLGVQNSPPGALPVALSTRLAEPLPPDADLTAGGTLTLAWSIRGAPHLHRTGQLAGIASACWPRGDADAAARLSWQGARLAAVDGAARWAYRTVAEAVGKVLERPLTKSELSTAVTAAVPPELSPLCKPCGVHHVGEQLLRVAALPGGARLRPGSRPLLIEPIPGWRGPPPDDAAGSGPLQEAYLRFFSPASEADVAGFLGTTRTAAHVDRPGDLVPVHVDGRAAAAPQGVVEAMGAAEPAAVLRLLPPSDPLLRGGDRELLVPDAAHRKLLWTAIGAPGAVLSGVDVVGYWRTAQRGRLLDVTVAEFRTLRPGERAALEEEAERLAVVRGVRLGEVQVGG